MRFWVDFAGKFYLSEIGARDATSRRTSDLPDTPTHLMKLGQKRDFETRNFWRSMRIFFWNRCSRFSEIVAGDNMQNSRQKCAFWTSFIRRVAVSWGSRVRQLVASPTPISEYLEHLFRTKKIFPTVNLKSRFSTSFIRRVGVLLSLIHISEPTRPY